MAFLVLPFFFFYLVITNTYQEYTNLIPQRLKSLISWVLIIVGYPVSLFYTWQNVRKVVSHIENTSLRIAILVFSVIIGIFFTIKLLKEQIKGGKRMSLLPELRKMLAFIDKNVDGSNTENSDRHIAAGTLFEAASCHAKGVSILLEEHLYASASALQRILFESFIRGSWLLHCASDSEVDYFLNKDKIKPYFGDLVSAVEMALDWPDTLSKIKVNLWKAMNSYTHGGNMQVTEHFDGSSIMQNHDPEEIEEMAKFSGMIAFLTFTQIIEMSNNREKDKAVEELYSQIGWCIAT